MPSIDDDKIEEIKKAWYRWEELKKEGTVRPLKDMAKALNVSIPTLRKYKPDDVDIDEVENIAKGKAEGSVISEVVKDISENATEEHGRVIVIGKEIKDKYEDMAKAYGLNVMEFVDGAVSFWDLYHDKVKVLEEENNKLELYIKKLVNVYSKEEMVERLLNNAISTSIALGVPIQTDELKKVISLVYEEMV